MPERSADRLEPVIGLEVHVQLATRAKLWCACAVTHGEPPNSLTCPVCLGLPGTLPTLNGRAVELAVRAALALRCTVMRQSRWDRKHYFYPDLPKNYQITQRSLPLAVDGVFEFPCDGGYRRVRIGRAHLEDDAGRSSHANPGETAVDLNRAGTPLLEIVTEPNLRSAIEVRAFAIHLHRLMRYLQVSDGRMAQGQMRFEPNVNLRARGGDGNPATPIVEIKNLNSFRSLHDAVRFEISRQAAAWRSTSQPGMQPGTQSARSNRGWDEVRGVTVEQREKEEPPDYRYFPDPDVPPLTLDEGWVDQQAAALPELPVARAARFVHEYGLPERDAPALVEDLATADLLDQAGALSTSKKTLGKHFLGVWSHLANERGTTIARLGVPAPHMAELADLVAAGSINASAAGELAGAVLTRGASPCLLAQEMGLLRSGDRTQTAAWVAEAMRANPQAVADAIGGSPRAGAARGYLVGQAIKLSGGRADPRIVGELLGHALADRAGGGPT